MIDIKGPYQEKDVDITLFEATPRWGLWNVLFGPRLNVSHSFSYTDLDAATRDLLDTYISGRNAEAGSTFLTHTDSIGYDALIELCKGRKIPRANLQGSIILENGVDHNSRSWELGVDDE